MKINRPERTYQNIANCICNLLPVQWQCIYFYAEVEKESVSFEFFFNEVNELSEYIHWYEIPKKYDISKGDFNCNVKLLFRLIDNLHRNYQKYTIKKWSRVIIKLEQPYNFNISYGSIDSSKTPNERREIWKRNVLLTNVKFWDF